MAQRELVTRPLFECLKRKHLSTIQGQSIRLFSITSQTQSDVQVQNDKASDSATASKHSPELEAAKAKKPLIGSRRRRAALRQSGNIPFEQLPFQCFQEARKVLLADRAEKLKQIETERARIARLKAADLGNMTEQQRETKLRSMELHLEKLKIWADFNDPIVKKKFEDGQGLLCIQ